MPQEPRQIRPFHETVEAFGLPQLRRGVLIERRRRQSHQGEREGLPLSSPGEREGRPGLGASLFPAVLEEVPGQHLQRSQVKGLVAAGEQSRWARVNASATSKAIPSRREGASGWLSNVRSVPPDTYSITR